MGTNITDQIRVKRALYVARMSGPNGNTTLVQPLSDSTILGIASEDIVAVLMDPLIDFQVSRGLAITLKWYSSRSRGLGWKLSCRSATVWRLAISGTDLHRKAFSLLGVSTLRLTRL